MLYSEQFNDAAWSAIRLSVTPNTTIGPDGNTTADSLIENTATATRVIRQFVITTASSYTFSVYAKANTRSWIYLSNPITGSTYFDLSNGTIGGTPVGVTASITSIGDGWYRCATVFTATIASNAFDVGITTGNNVSSYTGDGVSGLYIYGAQLEAGAYPTTYIPTTTASATRVADVAQKTSISSLIGQTEGTIFLDTKYLASATASGRWFNVFGTINNIGLALNGLNSVRTIINGLSDTITTSPKTDLGVKIAFAYNATGVVCFINGTEYSLPNGSSETMTSLDSILFDAAANPQFQQGEVNSFILFKTRLTNAELASLTTL
jgi:hypothetical protein